MYYNVLVVDDDQFQCKTIQLALEKMLSYNVQTINSGAEAIELITSEEGNKINMVILDLSMPEIDGLDVLRAICPQRPELPIIINTAYGDVKKAVEALKLGAVDFIEKQDGFERIKICIENVRLRSGLVREVKKLHQHSKNLYSFDDIIGKSSILQKSINQAKKAALSNIPVFISGESGVGKEMFARAIHCSSSRANKPFISVNCSAIPENLVESVLFGNEKGAFTGAIEKSLGKFREADGGTLFLDEVGELPADVQPKLLHALQNFEIEAVGSSKVYDVNIRVISATNRDVEQMIASQKFREDLFYRLNVFNLSIPSLRERKDDIIHLTTHFVEKLCLKEGRKILKTSPCLEKILTEYWWPGNVRQLENMLYKAIIMCDNDTLEAKDFSTVFNHLANQNYSSQSNSLNYVSDGEAKFKTLSEFEKDIIQRALEFYNGNISKVSKVLDLGRSTLYRKMKEYGIDIQGAIEDIEDFRREQV